MSDGVMNRGRRGSLEERFWRYVSPEPNSGCWLWVASLDGRGYGQLGDGAGGVKKAYRIAWGLYRGPIPDGMELDHKCRVRCCVNPDHLEVVSHRENSLRGVGAPAVNARKTHCVNGHEFTEENTYLWKGNERKCRSCAASPQRLEYWRNYRRRQNNG
jgi:hypothetical protein